MKASLMKPVSLTLAGLAIFFSLALSACGGTATVDEPEGTEEVPPVEEPVEEEVAPEGEEEAESAE